MLWDCVHCGCKAIADSVMSCPVCGVAKPDPMEGSVPNDSPDVLTGEDGSAGEPEPGEDGEPPDPGKPDSAAASRAAPSQARKRNQKGDW
jgi:hypothetical protein